MSNLSHLLQAYSQHPALPRIVKGLENQGLAPRIQLKGLLGAQESFVLAAAYHQIKTPDGKPYHHLFVANGKEEAAYRQNDLSAILGEERALFFPDSFKRPAFFDELNPTQALQRSEVVNLLSSGGPARVVVSYPEALFEKVVSPHVLDQSRIKINQNEDLDTDFLLDVFPSRGHY
jgi:transcription-repair coupling factor (superfamily II helicase)